MPSVTDRLLIMYGFYVTSLSLLQQLFTVGHGIFYMSDVNYFFSKLNNEYFTIQYFKTVF